MSDMSEESERWTVRRMLERAASLVGDVIKDLAVSALLFVGTFVFVTVVSAGLLWWYSWPLILAPVGGFIVLGVMLMLRLET